MSLRQVVQGLLAILGHPKTALGAARAHFWHPKHRAKSRPGAILVTLNVPERFGNNFQTVFDRFSIIVVRFSNVCGLVRNVAVWILSEGYRLPDSAAIDADPRRHKFIFNERPRSSPSALSHIVLRVLQTTTT